MIYIKEGNTLKEVKYLYIKGEEPNRYKAINSLKTLVNGQLVDLIYARPMILGEGKLGEATL